MTTSRQFADSEGDFKDWKDHPVSCQRPVKDACGQTFPGMKEGHVPCGAKVRYRTWESSCGGYEDHQYRCAGDPQHTWWIDGIDS